MIFFRLFGPPYCWKLKPLGRVLITEGKKERRDAVAEV